MSYHVATLETNLLGLVAIWILVLKKQSRQPFNGMKWLLTMEPGERTNTEKLSEDWDIEYCFLFLGWTQVGVNPAAH